VIPWSTKLRKPAVSAAAKSSLVISSFLDSKSAKLSV
jgi:hypothetical protein